MDKKTLTLKLSKTPKTPKVPKLSFTTTPVKTIKMRKVCKPAIFNFFTITEHYCYYKINTPHIDVINTTICMTK